ncbi:gamma carbonic anhydrase family protein [Leucobacter sp. UT-8R-CII-1-4]|uniref:gamma carbonic anhydrase family protein n=1 Tax=Leucobacter sp. UT-8R-CII-1-4 TaxID=3040075 RepID=UPI0024A94617|nr:gamma carbonic anhydrase family protein [Leucobacter sp. UT-8R-CII-1-4]MDI6022822.1 gamma carbonic anhydrase family protein [Leucobacter sp. UT-8R-CII-1-4]
MAVLIPFNGKTPQVHPTAWLAPNATLIGDVHIGAGASVWFGVVMRADSDRIELGAGSNLQDNVVVHTDTGIPTIIGENVGVGHLALLHGTTVGAGSLIGMGAKLLNRSVVGEGGFVAAGALVLEGQLIEAGHLAAGVPAKDRGPMNDELAARVKRNAFEYQELSDKYREAGV